jgi:transcriptional regulator with XRE-family HTH domain
VRASSDMLIRVMKQLTEEEFLNLIRDDVEAQGSQKALAAKLDVSEAYLSDVLRGRRSAGSKILSRYRMRAVTSYVPAEKRKDK